MMGPTMVGSRRYTQTMFLTALSDARMKSPALTFVRLGLSLTLLAAATGAIAATQWKWKDAEGRVQYSDRPPPSSVAEGDILDRPRGTKARAATAPMADASSADISKASGPKPSVKATDPQLEAKKRKAEEEAAKDKAEEDPKKVQARAEACQRSRNYEKSLTEGMRISRTNAKGEREVLDDAGRAGELSRTKEMIAANCNH
jgi:Domain of unknown function (DUF4124)